MKYDIKGYFYVMESSQVFFLYVDLQTEYNIDLCSYRQLLFLFFIHPNDNISNGNCYKRTLFQNPCIFNKQGQKLSIGTLVKVVIRSESLKVKKITKLFNDKFGSS